MELEDIRADIAINHMKYWNEMSEENKENLNQSYLELYNFIQNNKDKVSALSFLLGLPNYIDYTSHENIVADEKIVVDGVEFNSFQFTLYLDSIVDTIKRYNEDHYLTDTLQDVFEEKGEPKLRDFADSPG